MAQQSIGIGSTADDGTGDTLRSGGDKINDNFTELYAGDGIYRIAASDSPASAKALANALCDGTDDHIQIQAAVTALGSGGGVIELSKGTYTTDGTTELGSNTILRGNSATISHTGSSDFCLQIGDLNSSEVKNSHIFDLKFIRVDEDSGCIALQNCESCSVQRVTVDGYASQVSGPSTISLRKAYKCVVRDVFAENIGAATAVFPIECYYCTFENIEATACNGVVDCSSVGYSQFRNIRGTSCTEEIMDLGNFHNNVIDGVYANGTVNGIRLKCETTTISPELGSTKNRVANVEIVGFTQSGITMASEATSVQTLDYNQFTNIRLESTDAASTAFVITNGDVNDYNIGTQISNMQINTSGAGIQYNILRNAKMSNIDVVAGTNGIASNASSSATDASMRNSWSNISVDVPTSSTTYAMLLAAEVNSQFSNLYLEGGNNNLLINSFAQLTMNNVHCVGARIYGVSFNPSPTVHRGSDDGSLASSFTDFILENTNQADASNIQGFAITHDGTPELDLSDLRLTNWVWTDTQDTATIDANSIRFTVSGSGTFSNIILRGCYRYDGSAINVTAGVTLTA